ncbi:LysR family transcriptional regulator [uncultured Anaerococcus sp.]|uniref:LysR family transcriptional regulator n=1 Tax=uncultured Anaerococcus sp. TaxID=293428 RepID=UPI0028056309|nr:LysR family transcriptional regulator [uncultured Anaerococcus sp.]
MDINQMKYIICIAENNFNITKAADKLYISQPALSKTIKTLEENLGIDIFKRKKGRLVDFSDIGKILYQNALEIIDLENKIQKSILEYKKKSKSYISIGILSVFMPIVYKQINSILNKYFQDEDLMIDIVEYNYWDLIKKFEDGQIDIIITISTFEENENIINKNIVNSSYVAIYDKNKYEFDDKIKYSDLNNKNLIYPSTLSKSKLLIDKMLDKSEVVSKRKIHLMDPDAVLETLLNTEFIAILPEFFYTLLYQKYGQSLKTSNFTNPISWQMDISANKENIKSNEKFNNIFNELYRNLKTLEASYLLN